MTSHGLIRTLLSLRRSAALFLAVALTLVAFATATAGTTGVISGRATNGVDGKPLPGVAVTASSPSGRYTARTDAMGFYSFAGVTPDTYIVSFEFAGFDSYSQSGVTVFADQVAAVNATLQKNLRTIGRVVTRTSRGAFQPSQTQDTYSVTSGQISTIQGKSEATDEKTLLSRLPGASLDINGLPVLRGGRVDEQGFQYDGIEQTNAFNGVSINNYRLNASVGQLQLTPGPGDAASGNAGTGVINTVAKRGTYPAFSSLDLETLLAPYGHQFSAEYGFATRDGRFSNYVTFLGSREGIQYGPTATPAGQIGTVTYYQPSFSIANDFVDNFIYRFGQKNKQSLQLLYQNQQYDQTGTYGGTNLPYATADPYTQFLVGATLGLTTPQFQHLVQLYPGQQYADQYLGQRGAANANYTPSYTAKLEYANNVDASTYFSARIYETKGVTITDQPYNQARFATLETLRGSGGKRDGASLDATKQVGGKHLFQAGVKYETNVPDKTFIDPLDGLYSFAGVAGPNSSALYTFINPRNPNPDLAACPIDPPSLAGTGKSYCGYLTSYLGADPGSVPPINEKSHAVLQEYAAYITDTYSPTDRLKINAGLRLDGANYQLPSTAGCDSLTADTCQYAQTGSANGHPFVTLTNSETRPLIPQPRLAVAYRLSPTDAIRASYGRSVEFAPIELVDQRDDQTLYSRFANIPSYDPLGALSAGVAPGVPFPARTCGITIDRLCENFADQLHWTNVQVASGVGITPVKPETFTNFDFSYSHLFPQGIGLRVTPFYRRGYDALAAVAQPRLNPLTGQPFINPATGAPQYGSAIETNLGVDRTTGIELALTKESPYGLSGQISATYVNEFSNVVPTTPSEDFQPNIPTASLALGNLYRVGFVSPLSATMALSYRTHSGFRINPIVTFNDGYPIGVGSLVAAQLGSTFVNLPNTNATGDSSVRGVNGSPGYVDPQNPGTLVKPNINATRGLAETASPGGLLSKPSANVDVSFEYSPDKGKSTFGVLLTNLIGQTATSASYFLNDRYQPVATGISGPQTGYSAFAAAYPNHGISTQYVLGQYGTQPYLILNDHPPTTVRFYYQLKL